MADADGDALLFLDADDWLAPSALADLSATLDGAPEAVAAVGPYAQVDAAGGPPRQPSARRRPATDAPPRDLPARVVAAQTAPRDLLARLVVQNQFANGGHLLILRSAARRAGTFRPGVVYGEATGTISSASRCRKPVRVRPDPGAAAVHRSRSRAMGGVGASPPIQPPCPCMWPRSSATSAWRRGSDPPAWRRSAGGRRRRTPGSSAANWCARGGQGRGGAGSPGPWPRRHQRCGAWPCWPRRTRCRCRAASVARAVPGLRRGGGGGGGQGGSLSSGTVEAGRQGNSHLALGKCGRDAREWRGIRDHKRGAGAAGGRQIYRKGR